MLLSNPHGSDVTYCIVNDIEEDLALSNPHGSDVTLSQELKPYGINPTF